MQLQRDFHFGRPFFGVSRFQVGIVPSEEGGGEYSICRGENLKVRLEGSLEAIRGFESGWVDCYGVGPRVDWSSKAYELQDDVFEVVKTFLEKNVVLTYNEDGYACFYLTPSPTAFIQGYRAAILTGRQLGIPHPMQSHFELVNWAENDVSEEIGIDGILRNSAPIYVDDDTFLGVTIETIVPTSQF